MTVTTIFEPNDRAIPFAVEGEGPVSLVLLAEGDLDADGLAVISHYLADLPYSEVGALLETSEAAARRSAADGIANLRKTYRKGLA